MSYTEYSRQFDCPKCGIHLEATIKESGYGPANEWVKKSCPNCGDLAISENCSFITLAIKSELPAI